MLHIGVDEAGYGPLLGPLVIGLSAFRIDESAADPDGRVSDGWDPRLRRRLKGVVCRASTTRRGGRLPVPVDDSKVVLKRHGLKGLSRGVGAFCAALDQAPPAHLEDLLLRYSDRDPASYERAPWLRALSRFPLPTYPWTGPLEARCRRRGVQALDLRVLAADAPELNESFEMLGNKANLLGLLSATLLLSVLDRFPGEDALIIMDRHGGRLNYEPYLGRVFPFSSVTPLPAPGGEARYRVTLPDRTLRIRFATKGDRISLAVSWASMAAKLTRELFMQSFNAFFLERRPGVRPTAGYHTDGQRFLAEVEDVIRDEAIPARLLIRSR